MVDRIRGGHSDLCVRGHPAGAHRTFDQLLQAGATRSQVANDVLSGAEYADRSVTGWYASLLGRAPDASGLGQFAAVFQASGRPEFVIGVLLASPEFFGRGG